MPASRHRRSSVIEAHEIYLKYHRHHGEDLHDSEKEDDEEGPPTENSPVPPDLGGRDHKVNNNRVTVWIRLPRSLFPL